MRKADYKPVDWTKHDAQIARELGVTRAAVGKARKSAKAPPSQRQPKIQPLTQKEWVERGYALMRRLADWQDAAGEDLEAEMDMIDEIFSEARALIKLKP